ncbi:MAG: AIR synthase-related protein, partial [Pseudomonadota bacterium]
RKVIDRAGWSLTAPAPWTTETPDQHTLAQALLTPTRIYVRPLLDVLKGPAGPALKALAHITGGGLTENIPRVLPDHCAAAIDLAALTPAPVFGALASAGGIAEDEMLRTFNCGVGMVCVVAASAADEIAEQLRSAGEQVTVIGTLIHRSDLNDPQVQYSGASTFALASAGSNAQ